MSINRREQTKNILRSFKKEIPIKSKDILGVEKGFNKDLWKVAIRLARKSVVTGFGQSHSISSVARTIYRQHLGYEVYEEVGTFNKKYRKFEGIDLIDEYLSNHDVDIQRMYIENRTRNLVAKYGSEEIPHDAQHRTVAEVVKQYLDGEISLADLTFQINTFRDESGLKTSYDTKFLKEADYLR